MSYNEHTKQKEKKKTRKGLQQMVLAAPQCRELKVCLVNAAIQIGIQESV